MAARLTLISLLLLSLKIISTFCIAGTAEPTSGANGGGGGDPQYSRPAEAFVKAQCHATDYPQLCFQCLASYMNENITDQSQQQLAQFALLVSLARAWRTRVYLTNVAAELKQRRATDDQAVLDCLGQINDSVGQLYQSVKELRQISPLVDGEAIFMWHLNNVETWLSTAVTDATMCIDGFSGQAVGGKTKARIKAKFLNVAQLTSNALALFDRFAAVELARRGGKKP